VGMKPVQAASSFFVTLTVDSQNRDLVNLWRGVNVQGGDLLLLQLEFIDTANASHCQAYKLNHYYKGPVQRSVQMPRNSQEFRIGRSQGNLARTPDVAVVICLNRFLAPVDDTVTTQLQSQVTSHNAKRYARLLSACA
jgi:hypothetical protein